MNDILTTYMERFRENRHALRRYTAFVLALAMITTLFVNWQLHGTGISMTAQYQCGEEEHAHTADCYTKVLVCGYEEGELENASEVADAEAAAEASQPSAEEEPAPLALEPQIEFVPHEHTDDCYTEVQTLTCMEEEHVHDDDCYDPEDGSLICEKFEHTHDERCYTTEYELTCGLQEGELVEQVVEPTQTAELVAMAVAEPVALEPVVNTVEPIYHHHTDACYEEVLTCPLPEHHHTVACLSDTTATETPEEWQASTADFESTGNWDEDLLGVARTQLGYEQSEKNFEIDPADGVTLRYYTRYGASYNNPYGEWDVMFLSYCLKYAEIPQSAIPQEASVLALRSAMAGMDWLLDGEDGSAADVGDIVIYNKYVTRTVAVDSSADSAADDLDDLFSVDTEGENSAEPEDSGAAAEDTTVLDTPDIPDLPDTVDPEQPAVLSVASTAAEPQTTTVTDAESVETVGIVSEADEDTLTVISGDVDGKVAEVTLSNAEVVGVISVAYAQYADEMLSSAVDGALYSPMMLAVTGEPTTVSTVSTTLQESWITGTTITINDVVQTGSPINLTTGDKIVLNYNFKIPANTFKETDTNRSLTYQLPDGLYLSQEITGQDITQGSKVVGTMDVSKTGLVTLHLNDDFDAHQPFKGSFGLEAKVTTDKISDGGSISFPGSSVTIKVTDPKDIRINKTGSTIDESSGKPIIHYTVTVTSDNGWNGAVYIRDELHNTTSTSTSYVQGSFVLKDKNGNLIETNKYTLKKDSDNNGFTITGLPAMAKGEKYILTYDVEVNKTNPAADGSYVIKNNSAWTNDNKPSTPEIRHDALLRKNGTYDPDTGLITWVVTVTNYNGGTIPEGYTLTDNIQNGQTIVGDITVTERLSRWSGDDKPFATIKNVSGKSSFSYSFPAGCKGEEYKFTYKTTAPAEAGKEVKNDAYVPGGSTTGSTWTRDRGWNLNKAATNTALTETEKSNIYKAYWKITTAVPNNWDKKTITDYIYTPNKSDEGTHYGIAADLDAELKKNLRFNCTDGSILTYDEAVAAGIGIKITYYSDNHDQYMTSDLEIPANNKTEKVQAFKIDLTNNYNGTKHIKELVINDYYTYVDVTGVPNDKKVQYENKAGNSAYYSYEKKTPVTPSEIKKGVSGTKGGDITQAAGNDLYGKTATVSYNNDGKTYLYYQVLVDVSEAKNSDGTFKVDPDTKTCTITVTDKLPKGVTYVDGSAEATFWFKDGKFWNTRYTQWNLSTNGGGTLPYNHDLSDSTFFGAKATGDASSGQNLALNFYLLDTLKTDNDGSLNIKGFLIRYTVELDTTSADSFWRDPEATTNQYTNEVSWNGHSDDATATVNRVVNVLEKTGKQSVNTYGAKAQGADYTIKINPAGKDLVPGENYLTLTDTLTVENGFSATLDRESVKLYDANDLSTPLSDNSYTFSYSTSVNANGENVYTMVLTIPDQRAFVLKYSYDTDNKNHTVDLKNTADLAGQWQSETSEGLEAVSAWASVQQGLLTINKVDSLNQKVGLKDAVFTLSSFDTTNGKWVTNPNQVMRTDSNGKIAIYVDSTTMNATTLYRLTETDPPAGYRKSDVAYYFVWTPNGWTGTDRQLYDKVVGSKVQYGEVVPEFENVIVYQYGTAHDLYIKNDRNELTIQKFWVNKNGQSMNPTDVTSVTVKLYKYKADGTDGSSRANGIHVKDIELTSTNNWTATYSSLDDGYLYYIVEDSTGNKYEVTYSDSNTTGVENGGLLTLTNKEKDNSGYELPSTGGTGTLPYTAVGGTMMLTALAYSIIHRKRRHEGRADD